MAKTIVILGAGFGGIRTALTLENLLKKSALHHQCEIILIDKNRYHSFIPSLYEIASAAPYISKETLFNRVNILIKDLIKKKRITFIKAEVNSIDVEKKFVRLSDGEEQNFDYLVIALGAQINFFDIKGLEKCALKLKDFTDALRIKDSLQSEKERSRVLIGGGGTTGVELAAEVRKCLKDSNTPIAIVEGNDRILSSFSPEVSRIATKRLNSLSINLKLGHFIKEATDDEIVLDNGERLAYDHLLWSAGFKGNDLFQSLPFQREKNGMLKSSDCLHPLYENGSQANGIYAIGDATYFRDGKGNVVPWTAQKAINEGEKVAHTIARELKGLKETKCYPEKVRFIIPIGGKWAIASLGTFILSGFSGWVLKNLVELKYLLSILPSHRAIYYWWRAMLTFSKND